MQGNNLAGLSWEEYRPARGTDPLADDTIAVVLAGGKRLKPTVVTCETAGTCLPDLACARA
jgi:hypothetical protein